MLDSASLEAVTRPLAQASTLPPQAYTRADVFDLETREIFYKEWICVAREDQIPNPGDYRTAQIIDQPLIVVRNEDDGINALSAICPHRAMTVVTEPGNTSTFSCPYHLWKFALDGSLISAPLMDGVDPLPRSDCGLPNVRVETWQGFIFVSLDPKAPSLASKLASLAPITDGYDMGDMVVATSLDFDCPWNWKILVENWMEAYHHIGPHKDSVQPTHHAKDSYVSGDIEYGWSVLHMPEAPGQPEQQGLPTLPNLDDTQRSEMLASVIMPTFCWFNTPSVSFWYQLTPRAHDQMHLTIHTLLPRALADADTDGEIAAAVQASIEHVHLEDIAVNEGPWRGLHAPLTRQGRLSHLEEAIWQINQWWTRRIAQ